MSNKQPAFFLRDGKKIMRQATEVYSRVVGYLSPVHRWNKGKQEEFNDRRTYRV